MSIHPLRPPPPGSRGFRVVSRRILHKRLRGRGILVYFKDYPGRGALYSPRGRNTFVTIVGEGAKEKEKKCVCARGNHSDRRAKRVSGRV